MEHQNRRPWRRWIVLALMIAGFVIGGILIPVQPVISVKAENLLGEGVPWLHLPIVGELQLVNTLPTLLVTVLLIIVLVGQVGCVTLAVILISVRVGLWLDGYFHTRPLYTLVLLFAGIPLSVWLMLVVARRTLARLTKEQETSGKDPS